jgi:hypothetical protein
MQCGEILRNDALIVRLFPCHYPDRPSFGSLHYQRISPAGPIWKRNFTNTSTLGSDERLSFTRMGDKRNKSVFLIRLKRETGASPI